MSKPEDILVVTTGGTIDKVYFDAKSEFEVGEPQISNILDDALVGLEIRIVSLMQKDSLDLDDSDRTAIVAAIRDAPEWRVLVTHGTDTMTETADALAAAHREFSHRTIVLTGALNPARFRGTDAVFNVGLAVGAVQTAAPGVYIAMNGEVFPAGAVVKDRAGNRFHRP
jgi:L-asparaginase